MWTEADIRSGFILHVNSTSVFLKPVMLWFLENAPPLLLGTAELPILRSSSPSLPLLQYPKEMVQGKALSREKLLFK